MNRKIEITVGLFLVMVILSVLFLCFKVSDSSSLAHHSTYRIHAIFDNIGGLKKRSPVKIGGVVIGRVSDISLKDYKPYVSIDVDSTYNTIPSSSSLSIKTSGLLGEQFIDVSLGVPQEDEFDLDREDAESRNVEIDESQKNQIPDYFEQNFVVTKTISAVVIEDLIGKFLYSMNNSKESN